MKSTRRLVTRKLPHGWRTQGDYLFHKDPKRDDWSLACHEAAHVVVAEVVGERAIRATLLGPHRGEALSEYTIRRGRTDPMTRALIAMAGHEAEALITKRPITMLPESDLKLCQRLGMSQRSINTAGWLVRRVVKQWAPEIKAVARALLKKRTLTGREVRRLMRETP